MSLRVWLPLTDGTLKQQGPSNSVVASSGTVVLTSDGKLGKCATFGSAAGGLTIPASAMTSFTNACSVAFWLKINGWGSSYDTYFQAGLGSTPWAHYIFGFLRNNANSTMCFTISNGTNASNANYLSSALSTGVWYHVALTYETGKCKIYLNGSLDHEYSTSIIPNFSGITKITLGRCNNDSGYQTQCSMNDVRIYDHALSPLEVKEISQGLVLHYPLNDFYNESTTNLAAGSAGKNYITKEVAAYATLIKGKTQYENKIYTYSVYIKNTSDNPLAVRFNPYNADDSGYSAFNGNYIQPGHEGYSTVTADISDTTKWNGKVILYVQNGKAGTVPTNKTFYIKEVQLEQKDFATIYTDGTRTQTIISDCSGFGNNGTIINSSTHKKDGARYNTSMSFNGVNQCIQIPNLSTILTDTTYTMNVWFKKVTGEWSTKSWETIFGGPSGFELELKNGSSNSPVLYAYSWNKGNTTYTLDEWHMLTMVRTSSGTTFYLDGIQAFTGTAGSIPSGNYFIGSWRDSTSQNMRGYVSDFRLYSTALSEADIKSLYNTSASIDNLGNFHSFEFVEDLTDSIYKNGITSTGIDKTYLINNFTKTGNITGWSFGGTSSLSNGTVSITGVNPTIQSPTFTVGADDIICFSGKISLPTPSTSTGGAGLYLGTPTGTSTDIFIYNWNTNQWTLSSSASTNPYFIYSYNSSTIYSFKTYVVGSNITIDQLPKPSANSTRDLRALKLNATTTRLRSGYNTNTSMVINLRDFEVYNINQYGMCEVDSTSKRGKGYIQSNEFIEK